MDVRPSRRNLLQLFGVSVAAASLPTIGCAAAGSDGVSTEGAQLTASFFSAAERRVVAALADEVMPPDDAPGGAKLGAVAFIERLLTAFEDGPVPKLWAGGPYSGRTPFPDAEGNPTKTFPPNSFAQSVPLDRVSAMAWRLYLYGSNGVPGGGPNDAVLGSTPGLREDFKRNLARLDPDDPSIDDFRDEFRATFIDLVTQAAFAAPEYGGNPNRAGWKMVHFDGDSAPMGFSQFDPKTETFKERPEAPLSTANPGPDPDPLTGAMQTALGAATVFFDGRVF